ncbi:hypothetical protein [Enterococcus aquimarinus]|uniref:hypothetical protein n=1 Tax=Enterococcus aquimarinus TaxID=328396 RepID=UPI0036110A9D
MRVTASFFSYRTKHIICIILSIFPLYFLEGNPRTIMIVSGNIFCEKGAYLPAYHQSFGSIDVLVKVLNDGTSGVLVFNKSEETKNVTLLLSELPSVIHGNPFIYQNQIVTEVWGKEYQIREDMLEITDLAPHEVYVLQFKPKNRG